MKLSLLFPLVYLASYGFAIDTSQIHLELHPGLQATKRYVYNAILPFPQAEKLQDGNIIDIAFTAHEAMRAMHLKRRPAGYDQMSRTKQDIFNKQLPNVITAVASGDHVFIASSMKGPNIFYSSHSLVKLPDGAEKKFWKTVNGVCYPVITDGLKQCDKTFPNGGETVGHQNGGSCGEVMAAWAMCDIVGDAHISPARVVAVEYRGNAMAIKDPCGDDNQNTHLAKGCQTFNQHLQWRVIPSNTPVVKIGDLKIAASQVKYASYNFS